MSSIDRSKPPKAGPPPSFRTPAIRRARLASGLELLMAPRQGVPLVEILLLLPAGGELDPLDRSGRAALTAAVLDEGSEARSGLEIAQGLDRLGAVLATSCDWDAARIEATALAEHLPTLFEVVAEITCTPAFPPGEVERLRRQTLAEIVRRPDHPPRLADRALAMALYPGTPFAELLYGSASSVERISRQELVDFHRDHYLATPAQLVLCGEFDEEAAVELATRWFGDRPFSGATRRPSAIVPGAAERSVTIVDLEGAQQTELRIGHVGVPRTHPDRTRLGVLNALLGGKFTSRLNLNLRERNGFTYGVSSRFVDRRTAGPFVVATSVATESAGAAVSEVLGELQRLRDERVGEEELEETKSYLGGVFPYTFQTISGHVSRLADLALFGLGDDYFERALAEVASTTAAELESLAHDHLRPESAAIVAVGPASALKSQLEAFGAIRVVPAE